VVAENHGLLSGNYIVPYSLNQTLQIMLNPKVI